MNPVQLRNFFDQRIARALEFGVAILLLLTVVSARSTQSQTYTVLHSFTRGNDGSGPMAGVTLDASGNVYGVATYGGSTSGICIDIGGCGAVFRVVQSNGGWVFTPLYDFQGGEDGASPQSAVTVGPDGAIYGTTLYGGGNGCTQGYGCGTIFRLTPPPTFCHSALCYWSETVIYRFGPSLPGPFGAVAFDAAGNLYGTAALGGSSGNGAVYKLTPSAGGWTLGVIYNFTGGDDGAIPMSRVTMDRAGNLYSTATFGGAYSHGTVFELVRSGAGWTFNLLYAFQGGSDGGMPVAGVVLDSAGDVYGDNSYGGDGGGVVYELTPSGGTWTYSVIYTSLVLPSADLGIDSAGNLYGTSYGGGEDDDGAVLELVPSGGQWTETILHSFDGYDGGLPLSSVALDASGNLYGTTTVGGAHGYGVVWQLAR